MRKIQLTVSAYVALHDASMKVFEACLESGNFEADEAFKAANPALQILSGAYGAIEETADNRADFMLIAYVAPLGSKFEVIIDDHFMRREWLTSADAHSFLESLLS